MGVMGAKGWGRVQKEGLSILGDQVAGTRNLITGLVQFERETEGIDTQKFLHSL